MSKPDIAGKSLPEQHQTPFVRNPNRLQPVYLFDSRAPHYNSLMLSLMVRKRGINPLSYIRERINFGARIVAIGEDHGYFPHERTLVDVVKDITENSPVKIGTIAIEIPDMNQPLFDRYVNDGDKSTVWDTQVEELLRSTRRSTPEIVKVFKYAREHGIRVQCVDPSFGFGKDPGRYEADKVMHKQVAEIAEKDSNHVTIFYSSNWHTGNYLPDDKRQLGYRHVSDYFLPEQVVTIGQKPPDYAKRRSVGEVVSRFIPLRRLRGNLVQKMQEPKTARLLDMGSFPGDERLKHTGLMQDMTYSTEQVLGNYSAVIFR